MSELRVSADHVYLNILLSCLIVQEGMDALAETTAYRHELKATARRFGLELEKIILKDIPKVWGTNDAALYLVMDYQKELIAKLTVMRPEDFGVAIALIDKYKQAPDETLELLSIKMTDDSLIAKKSEAA